MRIISECYEEFLLSFLKQDPKPEVVRILKIQEEAGEAAEAFLSFSQLLWRKNNGASAWDVCMELADVAMTAMLAIMALGYGADQPMQAQMEKTLQRMKEISDQARVPEGAS
jgi:NTP pyrophosphatase (non-canonical NTP hydrolase)